MRSDGPFNVNVPFSATDDDQLTWLGKFREAADQIDDALGLSTGFERRQTRNTKDNRHLRRQSESGSCLGSCRKMFELAGRRRQQMKPLFGNTQVSELGDEARPIGCYAVSAADRGTVSQREHAAPPRRQSVAHTSTRSYQHVLPPPALPPAEKIGIRRRRGVDEPRVRRETPHVPPYPKRFESHTPHRHTPLPKPPHVQVRNDPDFVAQPLETANKVPDVRCITRLV
jgi:hypothetical protein